MKKIILGFVLPLAVALSSCTEFMDINQDPNYPADAKAIYLLPSGQVATASITAGEMQLVGSLWSQYYTQNPTSQQYVSAMGYAVLTSSYNSFWRVPYTGALKNMTLCRDKAIEEGRENLVMMSEVMMAFNFHLLTDWYGNIPFTEITQGDLNPHPKYEDSKTVVYPGMIALLDQAIARKEAALKGASPALADMVYGGDVNKWVKFAKTLKLKLLMRDFAANTAAITALLNEDDLLTEDAGLIGKFKDEYANSNPIFESDRRGLNTSNNLITCKTWTAGLLAANDPRIASIAETNDAAVFAGLTYANTDKTLLTENLSRARLAATDNAYFLSAVESQFLQAEAWLRLGDKAKAKKAYDAAMTASFARAKAFYDVYSANDNGNEKLKADLAAFLAGFSATQLSGEAYTTAGGAYYFDAAKSADELITLVMTQKWISAARCQAWDAYFDINRTGIPAAVFGYEKFPKRMPYPDASLQYNNNAPKVIPAISEKLWWQK